MIDTRKTLRAVVGKETLDSQQQQVGDVNGDGKVTVSDVRKILREAVGQDRGGRAGGYGDGPGGRCAGARD